MTTTALIATGDPALLDDLLRLAAAAGVEVQVAHTAQQAVAGWRDTPLMLCGADLADAAAPEVPRRSGVVLVTAADHPDSANDPYRAAVEIGAQDVAVLPDHESWLVDALATAAEPADGLGAAICVTGGRGGAGASVLATGLGLAAARQGLRTLLIDGDPLGGGLDLVLGIEQAGGARWPDLAGRRGRLSATFLRESLPAWGDLALLSWHRDTATTSTWAGASIGADTTGNTLGSHRPPAAPTIPIFTSGPDSAGVADHGRPSGQDPLAHSAPKSPSGAVPADREGRADVGPVVDSEAMIAVLAAATRGFDLVIVDVPRPPGPLGAVALRAADFTLLLVPAELRATLAADRLATLLRAENSEIHLVVREPAPGGLTPGMISEALALPLVGVLPDDRKLAAALEEGDLVHVSRRGPLGDLCDRLVTETVSGSSPTPVKGRAAA